MKKLFFLFGFFVLCLANISFAQKMTVKDSDGHVLMEVKDEGTKGSIMIPDTSTALDSETNKLYNLNGSLIWNGTALGTAGSAGGWTDSNGNVYLTTSGDKVGIGDTSPTHKLDVSGKIGINDTQVLYLPDQTDFEGTLMVGNGGQSLSHPSSNGGRYNTGVGMGALNATTTGYGNTATGHHVMGFNTTGNCNTANGYAALYANTEGDYNTATGYLSLFKNTLGVRNTADGYLALHNTTGSYNTGSGSRALYTNAAGDSNTALGYNADVSSGSLINATVIGANAVVDASNKVRIGNNQVTVIEGQVAFTFSSDKNLKENFLDVDGEYVLDEISRFDIQSWNYQGHDPQTKRHYGPVAQDFYQSFGQDDIGTIGTEITLCISDVAGINMIAIQALEKRTKEVKELKERIHELEKRMEAWERQ